MSQQLKHTEITSVKYAGKNPDEMSCHFSNSKHKTWIHINRHKLPDFPMKAMTEEEIQERQLHTHNIKKLHFQV